MSPFSLKSFLIYTLLCMGVMTCASLRAETDELKEWGIETQGGLSVEDTLTQARQMIDKGNSVSLGGIAKRVLSSDPSKPAPSTPMPAKTDPDKKPIKRAVRARPADARGPAYRVVLANGSVMTALAVREADGGYWVTAQEGVEAHFTSAEVLSVESLPG